MHTCKLFCLFMALGAAVLALHAQLSGNSENVSVWLPTAVAFSLLRLAFMLMADRFGPKVSSSRYAQMVALNVAAVAATYAALFIAANEELAWVVLIEIFAVAVCIVGSMAVEYKRPGCRRSV